MKKLVALAFFLLPLLTTSTFAAVKCKKGFTYNTKTKKCVVVKNNGIEILKVEPEIMPIGVLWRVAVKPKETEKNMQKYCDDKLGKPAYMINFYKSKSFGYENMIYTCSK